MPPDGDGSVTSSSTSTVTRSTPSRA